MGVKAPGRPTIMTFFPAQYSATLICSTSGNPCMTSTEGREVRVILEKAANVNAKGLLVLVEVKRGVVNRFVMSGLASFAAANIEQ